MIRNEKMYSTFSQSKFVILILLAGDQASLCLLILEDETPLLVWIVWLDSDHLLAMKISMTFKNHVSGCYYYNKIENNVNYVM